MKLHDELCEGCSNKKTCPALCLPMRWINGKSPRREPLIQEIKNLEQTAIMDYNEQLAELIEDRHNRIDQITSITDIRLRAITVMLLSGINKKQIAGLLFMSPKQITRITKQNKPLTIK